MMKKLAGFVEVILGISISSFIVWLLFIDSQFPNFDLILLSIGLYGVLICFLGFYHLNILFKGRRGVVSYLLGALLIIFTLYMISSMFADFPDPEIPYFYRHEDNIDYNVDIRL